MYEEGIKWRFMHEIMNEAREQLGKGAGGGGGGTRMA